MLALLVLVSSGIVFMARDSRPAGAVTTEIFFSLDPSEQTAQPVTALIYYPDGPSVPVYVYVKDPVNDPSGVAAFEVKFTYSSGVVSVTSLASSDTWLESTGRSATCTTPVNDLPIGPGDLYRADVGCYTPGTQPFGPRNAGNHLLGSFTLAPGSVPGTSVITNQSFILNTTADATEITATKRSMSVIIVECGDFNGDGIVSVTDIGLTVQHYGTGGGPPPSPNWDERYDMNSDNSVSVGDIGLVVVQFGLQCTA